MELGIRYENLYRNAKIEQKRKFSPVIIGFKKFTKISSTFDYCYCPDGVISILNDLDPKFIEELNNSL